MQVIASPRASAGFTLVEVLVAMGIIVIAAAGIGHLVAVGLAATRDAREEATGALLAMSKSEALRTFSWTSSEMMISPPDALQRDVPGYWEVVDAQGRPISPSAPPAWLTVYLRRWSIRPLPPGAAADGVVIQVLVTTLRGAAGRGAIDRARSVGEAFLTSVRTTP